ncbi:MAG TPA: adenylyl-sulfate kinase [Desulfobacteria bacterium]|nr:adenylyl-sulfate kinase [Desulfobacteria bacterium]
MAVNKATNVVWHQESVVRSEREKLLGQKGLLLWFTGLSGSGKSTIANAVARTLHESGKLTYVLDGDNIRHGLNKDLGFTLPERKENIRRIGEVARLFVDAGVIVLAAFISPLNEDRKLLRTILGPDFVEVYVNCPLEVCEGRDPKELYAKARAGEIKEFTGITSPYEAPTNPELTLHSDAESVQESAEKVLDFLTGHSCL